MFSKIYKMLLLFLCAILLSSLVSACSNGNHLAMMPADEMPVDVLASSLTVQTAYRFAAANSDVMKEIYCYCGCDSIGHLSNYDCYVSSVSEDGYITYDRHGLVCTTCVDITQDVMRMLKDGKSPSDAKEYVDATYGKFIKPSTP